VLFRSGAGFWHVTAPALPFVLSAEGRDRPTGDFWPELTLENSQEWRVGDPGAIKQTSKCLSLAGRPEGNFLVTRKDDYKKCSVRITLALAEGTEAYLALRAHQEPDGWRAVTSRVICEGNKVRAGHQSFDFQVAESGKRTEEKPASKPFLIRFLIDEQGLDRVYIGNKQTSSSNYAKQPAVRDSVGSVGLFVKSGRVDIESLHVSDK
jgi:hypothetical protein